MTDNQTAIGKSKAGRRFIAQMMFYNTGDFERLAEFMQIGYSDLILMANPIDRRILDLKMTRKLHGRLKVVEVEAAEEYAIRLIMETEKNTYPLRLEMKVDEDYPHQVLHFAITPVDSA